MTTIKSNDSIIVVIVVHVIFFLLHRRLFANFDNGAGRRKGDADQEQSTEEGGDIVVAVVEKAMRVDLCPHQDEQYHVGSLCERDAVPSRACPCQRDEQQRRASCFCLQGGGREAPPLSDCRISAG
jgi:hypothetical protein